MCSIKIFIFLLGISQGSFWTIHVRYHEERVAIIRLPPSINRIIDSGKAPINPLVLLLPNVSIQPDNHLGNGTTEKSATDLENAAEIFIQPVPSPPETNDFQEGIIADDIEHSEEIIADEITADLIIEKSDNDEEDSSEENDSSDESKETISNDEYKEEQAKKHNLDDFDDSIEENESDSMQLLEIAELLGDINESLDIINFAEKYLQKDSEDSSVADETTELPADFNTIATDSNAKNTDSTPIAPAETKPVANTIQPLLPPEILNIPIIPNGKPLLGHEKKEVSVMRVFYANGHDEMKSFVVGAMMTSGFCILVAFMWKLSKRRQQMMSSENEFKV